MELFKKPWKPFYIQWNTAWKCPYSELLWSTFFRIRTEYGEILRVSPYAVRMKENMDQNNSEYGHFLRSKNVVKKQYEYNVTN